MQNDLRNSQIQTKGNQRDDDLHFPRKSTLLVEQYKRQLKPLDDMDSSDHGCGLQNQVINPTKSISEGFNNANSYARPKSALSNDFSYNNTVNGASPRHSVTIDQNKQALKQYSQFSPINHSDQSRNRHFIPTQNTIPVMLPSSPYSINSQLDPSQMVNYYNNFTSNSSVTPHQVQIHPQTTVVPMSYGISTMYTPQMVYGHVSPMFQGASPVMHSTIVPNTYNYPQQMRGFNFDAKPSNTPASHNQIPSDVVNNNYINQATVQTNRFNNQSRSGNIHKISTLEGEMATPVYKATTKSISDNVEKYIKNQEELLKKMDQDKKKLDQKLKNGISKSMATSVDVVKDNSIYHDDNADDKNEIVIQNNEYSSKFQTSYNSKTVNRDENVKIRKEGSVEVPEKFEVSTEKTVQNDSRRSFGSDPDQNLSSSDNPLKCTGLAKDKLEVDLRL